MSYNCLSAATNLRCAALSRIQNGASFIPCILQIFVLFLLLYIRGANRWKWFLVAESATIFFLSLIDLLAHEVPEVRSSLNVFKGFDLAVGALSFAPVLFFCYVLYGLAREQCLPLFPYASKRVVHYLLILFIILVVVTDELGSFVGISHRTLVDPSGTPFLAIGFSSSHDQSLWLVFTFIQLAFLVTLQGFTFTYTFYLIIQGIQERRLSEENTSFQEWTAAHRTKGNLWIAVGIKLGFIETILGFVKGGFGVIFTRRLLRMLSRVCIFVGIMFFDTETSRGSSSRRRTAQLRSMISAPRADTFNRMSRNATSFYGQPRARANQSRSQDGFTQLPDASSPRRKERVTVMYDGATAPFLNLRLSDLDMPAPEDLQNSFNRRTEMLEAGGSGPVSISRKPSGNLLKIGSKQNLRFEEVGMSRDRKRSADSKKSLQRPPLAVLADRAYTRAERVMSASSLASDSGNALASQFPGLPPRVTARSRSNTQTSINRVREQLESIYGSSRFEVDSTREGSSVLATHLSHTSSPAHSRNQSRSISHKSTPSSSSLSLRRKAVPIPPPIETNIAGPSRQQKTIISDTPTTAAQDEARERRRTATTDSTTTPGLTMKSESPTSGDPFSDSGLLYRESELYNAGRGLGKIAQRVLEMEKDYPLQSLVASRAGEEYPTDPSSYDAVIAASEVAESIRDHNTSARSSYDPANTTIERARRKRYSVGEAMQPPSSAVRIKNIGVVGTRKTPTPSVSDIARKSMKVDEDDMGDIPTELPPSRSSTRDSLALSTASLTTDEAYSAFSSGAQGRWPRVNARTEESGDWMV